MHYHRQAAFLIVVILAFLLSYTSHTSLNTLAFASDSNDPSNQLNASTEDTRFGSELGHDVTTPLSSIMIARLINQIQRSATTIVEDPWHPDVAKHIATILDSAYSIPQEEYAQIIPYLDIVEHVLQVNPVRPSWHVTAIRASQSTHMPPIYIRHLEQIIDATTTFQYYERHEFAGMSGDWQLYKIGLEPPIIEGWNLPFLRAITDKIHEEPIQAQLLLVVARSYEALDLFEEAVVYYDRYLDLYFPRWSSLQIMHEDYPGKSGYIDPFFLDQPALSHLEMFSPGFD